MATAKHLKTIERRIEYLQGKVSEFTARPDADKSKSRCHWIKAEIAALTWALPILKSKVTDGSTRPTDVVE